MVRAIDITSRLVQLASSNDGADPLAQLRLHKILYFVQGWHLAAFGKPLFDEDIQAWKNGPVVASLWPVFARSRDPIRPEQVQGAEALPEAIRPFVESVWKIYKPIKTFDLVRMTHEDGGPWRNARERAGVSDEEHCSEVITCGEMHSHFRLIANSKLVNGLDAESCYRGAAEFDRIERGEAKGMTHQEFWAKIRARRQG